MWRYFPDETQPRKTTQWNIIPLGIQEQSSSSSASSSSVSSSSSLSSSSCSHETNPSRNTRELSSSVLVVSCQEEPEVLGCSSSSPVWTSTRRSTWGRPPTRSLHRRSSPRTASPSSSTPSCTTRWEFHQICQWKSWQRCFQSNNYLQGRRRNMCCGERGRLQWIFQTARSNHPKV